MMDAAAAADRDARVAWITGGSLLIVNAVSFVTAPALILPSPAVTAVVYWTGTIAFSAALILFAFGLRRSGSVVARRPLGVAAMVLLALWPFVERLLTFVYPFDEGSADFYRAWGYVSISIELAAALVIVVQIARAGVVTGRLRWAPTWALAAVVVPQVLAQLLVVALHVNISTQEHDGIIALMGLGQLATFAAPLTLGILAIIVANRPASRAAEAPAVQVFPPET